MSAGFNFNNITLGSAADITKVMQNFDKIEQNGITYEDAKAKATTNADGVMSKEDKNKLNGIQSGAQANNINTVKLNDIVQQIVNGILTLVETDPTVPAWAKAQNKPTYDWSEIANRPYITTQTDIICFWKGTQAQYDSLATKYSNYMYLVYEEDD